MDEDVKFLLVFGIICYVALFPIILFFSVAMFNNLWLLPVIVAGLGIWLWLVMFVSRKVIQHL